MLLLLWYNTMGYKAHLKFPTISACSILVRKYCMLYTLETSNWLKKSGNASLAASFIRTCTDVVPHFGMRLKKILVVEMSTTVAAGQWAHSVPAGSAPVVKPVCKAPNTTHATRST